MFGFFLLLFALQPPVPSSVSELPVAIDAILQAGERVKEIYSSDFAVIIKDDTSPITQADLESSAIITAALQTTGIPILSEEESDDKARLCSSKVWIVDPLDGTTDFVNRTGEFTIMIGLVEDHVPIIGLIYRPTTGELYFAEKGKGAFCFDQEWRQIRVRKNTVLENCLALVSRFHLSDKEKRILSYLGITKSCSWGSSLKVTQISSGGADIYFTMTNKMKQWDTCASYCIIHEAGGRMTDSCGGPLLYNTDQVNHEHGLLVTNGFVHDRVAEAIAVQY
ncbi:MAG: 3'(2'),5'-bisphosphate nucleotidase CysQ [Chlamydiales bacterium]